MTESRGDEHALEVLSLERCEVQMQHGSNSGWTNKFIIRVNRETGETWILRHIPGIPGPDDDKNDHALRWVPIPLYPVGAESGV